MEQSVNNSLNATNAVAAQPNSQVGQTPFCSIPLFRGRVTNCWPLVRFLGPLHSSGRFTGNPDGTPKWGNVRIADYSDIWMTAQQNARDGIPRLL